MKYNSNLFYITALRARMAVITNAALSLVCCIAAVTAKEPAPKVVLFGVAMVSSANGLMALRSQEAHQKAQEDVADVSDQVRTNDIYRRLQGGDEPTDFTAQTYNYLVDQLGQGHSKEQVLLSLDKDPQRARLMWTELEQRYGKLPTGDY